MGHVVKAKERAEVKRCGGCLHHRFQSLSHSHVGGLNPTSCNYSSCLWCLNRILFLSFEAWRRPPPATTEDNYTKTERVPQDIGVLPYAASYHLQCLCKTDKLLIEEPDKKGSWCAESRRDREDRITSPSEPLTSTHWGQKNHTGFLKFQSQWFLFFFCQFLSGTL